MPTEAKEDVMVSERLRIAIFLHHMKGYQIAQQAGLHPTTLSKLLHGIEKVKPGDPRILKVGEVVGVPGDECFIVGPNRMRASE